MVGHGTLFAVTSDNSTGKIRLCTQRIKVLQKAYKNVDLPDPVGPSIIQVNGCLNLISLAMNVL
jgi:hypothetical protein